MSVLRPPREAGAGGILSLSQPGTPPGGGYPIWLLSASVCIAVTCPQEWGGIKAL